MADKKHLNHRKASLSWGYCTICCHRLQPMVPRFPVKWPSLESVAMFLDFRVLSEYNSVREFEFDGENGV